VSQPTWRRDGRRRFYTVADGTMMAGPNTSEPRFELRAERALFHSGVRRVWRRLR
jgi:hypothetical protein